MEDGVSDDSVVIVAVDEDAIHVKEAGANGGEARVEYVNLLLLEQALRLDRDDYLIFRSVIVEMDNY